LFARDLIARNWSRTLLAISGLSALATLAHAQPYSIDWYTIDGGGGTSSSSTYTISGTIGQHDAGLLIGPTYTVQGGFWAFPAGTGCLDCPADYNQDGGVTGDDIAAFFADYEAGAGCADTNLDGGITGDDIAAYFSIYEAGGC